MVGWTDHRTAVRRGVHGAFGEPFAYTPPDGGSPVVLLVRHRTRQNVLGMIDNEYSTLVESTNRLVFSSEDLEANEVVLRRGGRIEAPPFLFELDQPEPLTGPIEVPWTVTDVTHAS